MTDLRTRIPNLGRRRLALSAVVLVFVGVIVALLGPLLLFPFIGWFVEPLNLFPDAELGHFVHDAGFTFLIWAMLVGMLAQLRSPVRKLTSMLMVLVILVVMVLGMVLASNFDSLVIIAVLGGLWLIAALLHPARDEFRSALRFDRVNRVMLVLVLVAAIPLLAFAAANVNLQTGATDGHAHDHEDVAAAELHEEHLESGHFMTMAATAFAIIGLGLLGSFRAAGWWHSAWFAGLTAAALGLASVLYPDVASSAGLLWGSAAILWGVAFIAASEYTQEASSPTYLGARRATTVAE